MNDKKEAAGPDFAAYVSARDASDNALEKIREIRAGAKDAKALIAKTEPSIMGAMDAAGGRLVTGDTLLEFTKGRQVRVTTVARA
jgi:hypothetical protein